MSPSPDTHLAFGEWGAVGAQIVASDSVTEVNVGCTGGRFAGNVALNSTGSFFVNGSWSPYAGPLADNYFMPAQMSGQVSGGTVTFAVAVYDTVEKRVISVAPATAVFGHHAVLVVCP
jgi:hypothetical protein